MNEIKINEFKTKYVCYYLMNRDDISFRSQTNEALLYSFFEKFGIEELSNLKINDYCFEKGNKDTFCYWFDYQLNDLCDIHIRKTGAFQKYHIQKNGEQYKFLKKNQKRNKFGSTYNEVFKNVKQEIIKIANASLVLNDENIEKIKTSRLHESFKAKLTYVYGAKNWVPILVESDVNKILDWFGVSYKVSGDLTSKRIQLFNIYKKVVKNGLEISTWDFMRFFYSEDGLRSLLRGSNSTKVNTQLTKRNKTTNKKQISVFRDVSNIEVNDATSIVFNSDLYYENDAVFSDEDFERIERIRKRTGKQGELIVYYYLKRNKTALSISKIEAPCFDGKNNLHYDISYIQNGIRHYIEVKATSSRATKTIHFEMSKDEYIFMSNHLKDDLYEIFYVQNAFGMPNILKIKPNIIFDNLKTKSYFLNGRI